MKRLALAWNRIFKNSTYLLSFSLLVFRLFVWRRVLFCPSARNPPPKMLLPSASKSSAKSSESRKCQSLLADPLSGDVECRTERRLLAAAPPLVLVGAGVWNSPYIRLMSALFSSINFSIGSLKCIQNGRQFQPWNKTMASVVVTMKKKRRWQRLAWKMNFTQ